MTRQASDNPISNGKIRQAVAEIASSVDLEETSFKKMQRLVWRIMRDPIKLDSIYSPSSLTSKILMH